MKRPLAYISAAWSGEELADSEQAVKYCRAVYEAGFSPVCPRLYLPLYIDDAIPREPKAQKRNLIFVDEITIWLNSAEISFAKADKFCYLYRPQKFGRHMFNRTAIEQ